ncbi:hypothetical protein J6590_002621 [Homalodisca vitripennis]|nr:hypothetical protein J6590_002621 [Homalodisca vitripennis]
MERGCPCMIVPVEEMKWIKNYTTDLQLSGTASKAEHLGVFSDSKTGVFALQHYPANYELFAHVPRGQIKQTKRWLRI